MRFVRKILILTIVSFCFLPLQAQKKPRTLTQGRMTGTDFESVLSCEALSRQIEFLSDSLCQGRAMQSPGGSEAAFWILRQFGRYRMMPVGGSYVHTFDAGGRIGHNVMSIVPGMSGKYIIVAAHYDGLGTLDGSLYPGADSNASGVAAMLQLAHIFESRSPFVPQHTGIIFVALDGKQMSMAGAQALYKELSAGLVCNPVSGAPIHPSDISFLVNLDIIGSTLEPVHKDKPAFLIMLGGAEYQQDLLRTVNRTHQTFLDLSFDYYGSSDFTDLFFRRISDQKVFLDHGIPAVMFTSGITMRTNRQDDTLDSLDLEVLRRRVVLIYRWLERQV